MLSIFRGAHLERDEISFARAKRVVAEALDEVPVLIDFDGEVPGRLPVEYTIRPKALMIRG